MGIEAVDAKSVESVDAKSVELTSRDDNNLHSRDDENIIYITSVEFNSVRLDCSPSLNRTRLVMCGLLITCLIILILTFSFIITMIELFAPDPFKNGDSKTTSIILLSTVWFPFLTIVILIICCMILTNCRDRIHRCVNPV